MNLSTFALAQLVRVIPRTTVTRATGRLCDARLPPLLSRAMVGAYARAFDVDLAESAPLNGQGCYPSFDAFFTRKLREGARPCQASGEDLACPADGRLVAAGQVEPDGLIEVKRQPYRAAELLGGERDAERHLGGAFAVIYLSPRDYHRVHAPAECELRQVRSYPGELFPVNSVSERHIPGYLVRNRRVAIALDSPTHGRLTVVMVAALMVGRITVTGVDAPDIPLGIHQPAAPLALGRGAELGVFHLGSTVVLFAEPSFARCFTRPPGPVRVGEALRPTAEEAR